MIGDEAKLAENDAAPGAHPPNAGCWNSTDSLGIEGDDIGFGAGGVWTLVGMSGC